MKSYVRNTITLSCAKILLTSVIGMFLTMLEDGTYPLSSGIHSV